MSSILGAYEKNEGDPNTGSNPDSILERNATYREAIRNGAARAARDRMRLILSGVCLGLALVALLAIAGAMMKSSGGSNPGESQIAVPAPTATPVVTPTPTPTPELSPIHDTPPLRESVQLRTRPLLHPAATPEAPLPAPTPVFVHITPITAMPTGAPIAVSTQLPSVTATPRPTSDDPREFLILTGAMRDTNNPTALINDRLVGIGQSIEGAKILSIDDGPIVRVEYKGKEYELRMN